MQILPPITASGMNPSQRNKNEVNLQWCQNHFLLLICSFLLQFLLVIFSGRNFFWVKKICVENKFGTKKNWAGIFLGKKNLGRKFCWVKKNLDHKFCCQKKIWSEILLGQKKFNHKFCCVKKKFGRKYFFVSKKI